MLCSLGVNWRESPSQDRVHRCKSHGPEETDNAVIYPVLCLSGVYWTST